MHALLVVLPLVVVAVVWWGMSRQRSSPPPSAPPAAGTPSIASVSPASGFSEISGSVFVTMQSGDVKRGAGTEVAFIPATEQFESEWAALVQEFRMRHAEARAAYEEARRRSEEENRRWVDTMHGYDLRRSDEAYRRSRNDAERSAYETYRQSRDAANDAGQRIASTVGAYRERALKSIRSAQIRTVETDVDGRYESKNLPSGRHFVYAHLTVFDNDLHWMVPVQLKHGSLSLDLSNSNAGWPFDG